MQLVNNIFSAHHAHIVLNTPLFTFVLEDVIIWKGGKYGAFSVRRVYKLFLNEFTNNSKYIKINVLRR